VQADGSSTDVLGTITVKIGIKGISMDINVTVVSKLHNGFLLGARELNKMEAQINCHKSVVSFFGGTVSTPLLSATSLINTVSATRNVTLRPQKGINLEVQASNNAITDGKHYIVEPFTDNRHGVMVPQLITKSTGHSLYIPVCNFTDSIVSIIKGRPIATVYEMQQHGLSVLEPAKPSSTAHAEPVTATKPQCEYKINKDLPPEQQIQLKNLLDKYSHLFAKDVKDLPECTLPQFKMYIDENVKPVCQRRYRPSPAAEAEIERQVGNLLEAGLISRSNSPFASPVVLVRKKAIEGQPLEFRLVIDYRRVNSLDQDLHFDLPLFTDVLEALAEAKNPKIFSCCDLKSFFHSIPIEESSRRFTAFTVRSGRYHWNRLSMGVKNAPAFVQSLMQSL
jgi:hypothetical protein